MAIEDDIRFVSEHQHLAPLQLAFSRQPRPLVHQLKFRYGLSDAWTIGDYHPPVPGINAEHRTVLEHFDGGEPFEAEHVGYNIVRNAIGAKRRLDHERGFGRRLNECDGVPDLSYHGRIAQARRLMEPFDDVYETWERIRSAAERADEFIEGYRPYHIAVIALLADAKGLRRER